MVCMSASRKCTSLAKTARQPILTYALSTSISSSSVATMSMSVTQIPSRKLPRPYLKSIPVSALIFSKINLVPDSVPAAYKNMANMIASTIRMSTISLSKKDSGYQRLTARASRCAGSSSKGLLGGVFSVNMTLNYVKE